MIEVRLFLKTFILDKKNLILKEDVDETMVHRYYVIINGEEYQIEYYYYKELRRELYA